MICWNSIPEKIKDDDKISCFPTKKGMWHVDPAWERFALLSSNLLDEILYKGVLFNLFLTSLVSLHFYDSTPTVSWESYDNKSRKVSLYGNR